MKIQSLTVPLFVLLICAVPTRGQTQRPSRAAEAVREASGSLDRYQALAASFQCDENEPNLRNECTGTLKALSERVENARRKIAAYETSRRRAVALFDVYQAFQDIGEMTDQMAHQSDSYNEQDREISAEVYNNFVKITMWLGSEVRDSLASCGAN